MASTRPYSVRFHPRRIHPTDYLHPAVYAAVVQAGRVESQWRIETVLVEMAVVDSVLVEQTTLIKSKSKEDNIMINFWNFFKQLFKLSDRQVKAMRFDPGNISRRYVHRSTQAKRRKLERRGCR
jgi:hypothetical protein